MSPCALIYLCVVYFVVLTCICSLMKLLCVFNGYSEDLMVVVFSY
jgi:hypothetical protein